MSGAPRSPRKLWAVAAGGIAIIALGGAAKVVRPAVARKIKAAGQAAAAPDLQPAVPPHPVALPGPKLPSVGINLSGTSYWSAEWIFVDLVKRIRDWGGKPGLDYKTDDDGWITWIAPGKNGTAMIGDGADGFQRNFPLGRYVALYKGKGSLRIKCSNCREVSREPGRIVVDILDTNYVWVIVDAVDESDHIRDVALVPIEHEKTYLTHPFHPEFLERLRSFAALRQMGNMKTNGNTLVHWSDRPKPTRAFQDTDKGVALEYLVDLANESATDAWFSLPVRVDDDYVKNFARLVWKRLDPKRSIYVEYGNEIWNDAYPYGDDGKWLSKRGRELNIPLEATDDGSDMTYRLRYQVIRSREIFEIIQREMAALKIDRKRLVRVIASQASFYDRIRQTLDFRFPDGTRAYQHADALAVAPYFAGLWSPEDTKRAENDWSVDQIVDYTACTITGSAPGVQCPKSSDDSMAAMIRHDYELAQPRGLRLVGYEGGQHMMAWNEHPSLVEKLAWANRSPRMKDIYRRYLEAWRDNGGDLMLLVNFVQAYGKFGYWGMLERQDQPVATAPKMAGTLEFMQANARWWPAPTARAAAAPATGDR